MSKLYNKPSTKDYNKVFKLPINFGGVKRCQNSHELVMKDMTKMLPFIIHKVNGDDDDRENIYWNMRAVLYTLKRKSWNGSKKVFRIGTNKFNIEELGLEMGIFDYKYRYCFDEGKEKILKTPPDDMSDKSKYFSSGWTYLGRHMVVSQICCQLWNNKFTYKELYQCLVRTIKIMCHNKSRYADDVFYEISSKGEYKTHVYTSQILHHDYDESNNGIIKYYVDKAWFERCLNKLEYMNKITEEIKFQFKNKYIYAFKLKYDNDTYLNKWTVDKAECCICYEETKCIGLHCCGNHNHVCVECFEAVRTNKYRYNPIVKYEINGKKVCGVKFLCPMCRGQSYINHNEFEKVERLYQYNSYCWNSILRELNNNN
tara:strand:+ start:53 stop:1165 length:1113 start_codon:yes stop_codon:yes gene_type:complete